MKVIDSICPECGERMKEGFILDEVYGNRLPSYWLEGVPIVSKWTGLKVKGKDFWRVATYRCTECGFLKSYARERKEK